MTEGEGRGHPAQAVQLSLLDPRLDAGATAPPAAAAFVGVAQVLVDVPLAHLDRTFDYGIPAALDAEVRVGVRVKVRFAGTDKDGFVIGRTATSAHAGALAPLRRVVSALPVLTEATLHLCRAVAARYAGTTTDVLRLAVPPRHAAAERAVVAQAASADPGVPVGEAGAAAPGAGPALSPEQELAWFDYPGGGAFLRRLAAGAAPRAVWCALPGLQAWGDGPLRDHWALAIAAAVGAARAGGRGALVIVPDARDLTTLGAALDAVGIAHVALSADQGAQARYRRFALALTGQAHVVIGTRSAAFAPVANLGLVVCWDDGDDLLAEQRAPYPHAREVLVERAEHERTAALFGGFARTPEAELLVADGWARSLHADRPTVRRRTARVSAPSEVELDRDGAAGRARIPTAAWTMLKRALAAGPALVQVPRAGYLPLVACARCRTPARCMRCHGPLRLDRPEETPQCRLCGKHASAWSCHECQGTQIRAVRIGSSRTAEELGRAFPGVPVVVSGREGGVLEEVPDTPRLVVATPGAEPAAVGGYRAALLLDAALTSNRPELSAAQEALRRWLRAAALVRGSEAGGEVMILGQGAPVPVQALVRWDPIGHAQRELAERSELLFAPLVRMAAVTGTGSALASLMRTVHLPAGAEVLGPVPVPVDGDKLDTELLSADLGGELLRTLVRIDRAQGNELSVALAQALAVRSARKEPGTVRVRMDPARLW